MENIFLSDSNTSKVWLNQFIESDQEYAKLLLDSLTLISEQRLVRDLQTLIDFELNDLEKPVALIPVREMARGQTYYRPINNRNAKPNLIGSHSFPGSEAIIANIATRMSRLNKGRNNILSTPSLKKIRDSHCRSVLFVDDFIGSGTRVNSFFESFYKNKTIKSWTSYKYISFYVFTYSITNLGLRNVESTKRFRDIKYVLKCPTFDEQDWTWEQRERIEKLCKLYAPVGSEDMALGFNKTKGMMVFEHSAPNNLPAILWKVARGWKPPFPNRAVPIELTAYFRLPPIEERIEQSLKRLGQIKLANGQWIAEASPLIKKVILVLGALSKKTKSLERISDFTCLPTIEIRKIIIHCREWGLIDRFNKLTNEGVKELDFARKMKLYARRRT
jgi:hypothetical protein